MATVFVFTNTVVRRGWTTQPCARENGTALLVQVEGSAMFCIFGYVGGPKLIWAFWNWALNFNLGFLDFGYPNKLGPSPFLTCSSVVFRKCPWKFSLSHFDPCGLLLPVSLIIFFSSLIFSFSLSHFWPLLHLSSSSLILLGRLLLFNCFFFFSPISFISAPSLLLFLSLLIMGRQ